MPETVASRTPGRPKDQEKRAAIIAAAQRLFLRRSYDRVTMELVAADAGVAKMTVYGNFSDKEALLEAVIQVSASMMAEALPKSPPTGSALQEELVSFGRVFLSVVLSPMVNALFRQFDILARNHALAERVYNAGPGHCRAMLGDFLAGAAADGELSIEDPIEAASDLMTLWMGDIQMKMAMDMIEELTPVQVEQRVRRCTRLFLRAYAP